MPIPSLSNRRKGESVRGFFVLGVIAVLVVLRTQDVPDFATVSLDVLLAFWGAYAFLAVLALSDDVFGERIGKGAYLLSLFALGCAVYFVITLALLYVATSAIVSLILYLEPPLSWLSRCVTQNGLDSNGLDLITWLALCMLMDVLRTAFLFAAIFTIGLIPALVVPPIIVARGMSKRYGKTIWRVCAATEAVIIILLTLAVVPLFI